MDSFPSPITATCRDLLENIAKTSLTITGFVREVRRARADLDFVSRELVSLKTVLELLAEDASNTSSQCLPNPLKKPIAGIITNCGAAVVETQKVLANNKGNKLSKAAMWATGGKDDIAKLRLILEAYKSALAITFDMVTLTLTTDTIADTEEIWSDASAQILAEIARLQQQLPGDVSQYNESGITLERYLDDLVAYAEGLCDAFADDGVTPQCSDDEEDEVREEEGDSAGQGIFMVQAHDDFFGRRRKEDVGVGYTTRIIESTTSSQASTSSKEQRGGRSSSRSHIKQEATQAQGNPAFSAPIKWSSLIVKDVKLFNGNLLLDVPIIDRILNQVPHASPPERDEFTHGRYSAVTCPSCNFIDHRFVLRPSLFAKPRNIQLVMAISLSGNYSRYLGDETLALASSLRSIIRCVRYLCAIQEWTWGQDSWKRVNVVVISKGPVSARTRAMLENMGICWPLEKEVTISNPGKGVNVYGPVVVNNLPVRAHCLEYSTQFTPLLQDGHSVSVVKSWPPVQMVICLQVEKFAESPHSWTKAFADLLRPRVSVEIDAGTKVKPDRIMNFWNAAAPAGLPSLTPNIVPYRDESFLRTLLKGRLS